MRIGCLTALVSSCGSVPRERREVSSSELRRALVEKETAVVRLLEAKIAIQDEALARLEPMQRNGRGISISDFAAVRSALLDTRIRYAEATYRLRAAREASDRGK